jgi:hypothetical protein
MPFPGGVIDCIGQFLDTVSHRLTVAASIGASMFANTESAAAPQMSQTPANMPGESAKVYVIKGSGPSPIGRQTSSSSRGKLSEHSAQWGRMGMQQDLCHF